MTYRIKGIDLDLCGVVAKLLEAGTRDIPVALFVEFELLAGLYLGELQVLQNVSECKVVFDHACIIVRIRQKSIVNSP